MSSDDINRIINAVNLYALATDTQRWELFDLVFTPDVEADYGPGIHWHDIASFKRDFAAIHGPLDASQHVVTNHQVDVKGDRAHAFSYVVGRLMRHMPEGGADFLQSGGWYDDTLVRTPSGWRIQKRVCRSIWFEGNPRVLETMPGAKVKPQSTTLRREAEAGNLAYVKALAAR